MMSGLSHCAGVVLAEQQVARLKHIEFVLLEPGKALVILVGEDQTIENRIISLPRGLPPSALVEAANYLNTRVRGSTIAEARARIEAEQQSSRAELDELTQKVIQAGLAELVGLARRPQEPHRARPGQSAEGPDCRSGSGAHPPPVRRSGAQDATSSQLLGLSENADGVRIFIGSENKLFSLSGSSLIVAPFHDDQRKIVGVLGVIGPTRINYARIIPMVDYTAKLVSRLLT